VSSILNVSSGHLNYCCLCCIANGGIVLCEYNPNIDFFIKVQLRRRVWRRLSIFVKGARFAV
ncbi:MAG: hypothetical protein UF067_04655, partial [Paludibacteraceae bacterium]|nr:hypothetical protein [Paludibacteraceae bacterium]